MAAVNRVQSSAASRAVSLECTVLFLQKPSACALLARLCLHSQATLAPACCSNAYMIHLSHALSTVDPCSCAGRTAAPLPQRVQLQLLASQQGLLESMLHCIERGWMPILVGPTASGKTSLVRLAAQLAGRPLSEVVLTSGTDTSDLLGGFEQLEPSRKLQVCLLSELHPYPAQKGGLKAPATFWVPLAFLMRRAAGAGAADGPCMHSTAARVVTEAPAAF